MAKRGGKRPGAGRPKGSGYIALETMRARELFIKKLEKKIGPIIDMLIVQASKGNMKAAEILFDRSYGKSPQPITGPEGESPTFNITLDESQLERIAGRIRNGNNPGKA